MPNFGPDFDLGTRLKKLEDLVARMAANPLGQAFSFTQSDGSIGMQMYQDPGTGSAGQRYYQGTTTSRDPSTAQHPLLMYIGELVSGGAFVDSGVIFYRPDANNSESLIAGNKGVQILDPQGFQVFGTDEYGSSPSGIGLNNPRIDLGVPQYADATKWPQTTATGLTQVALLTFPAQHSQVTWTGSVYCPAGTTGEVQVTVNNGAAGATHSVGAGFTSLGPETIPLGSGNWGWQEVLTVVVSAAVTSGAGPVYVGVTGMWGQGAA